ncbi:MAG: alpha/beta hydrolase [Cyanobacteria bacterium P01_F01_bin.53]
MDFAQTLQRFVAYYSGRWEDATISTTGENGFTRLVVTSPALLRDGPGNSPQIFHHGTITDNVIVLIHGLTDSPYYMQSIAQDFARVGFNVVLPLLPAHGLRRPGRAFHQLKHTDWIETIDALCDLAKALGKKVSIGGLSTGGALSVRKAVKDPQSITGGLFLFSAALDIGTVEQLVLQTEAGRMIARLRDQQLWLAKTVREQLEMILDDQAAGKSNDFFGIGKNDYKYSVLFYEGASQLAEVVQEINEHYDKHDLKFSDLAQPTFVAHARDDDSALFRGVQLLVDNHPNEAVELFAMTGVPHSSVVLKQAIVDDVRHEEYAPANPFYEKMSRQMLVFAERHLTFAPDIC